MAMRKVLVFGASYGSLLAVKLALAGHSTTLVCRARNAALINASGVIVRMPVKGRDGLVEVRSRELPGRVGAATPDCVNPGDYDLVVLAMQEPQYRSPGVGELLEATARSRVPCMSIMNMPPLPYLARIPGIDAARCGESYTDPALWEGFDPKLMTLCSPDAQAFRPPEEEGNVLQVRLASNFKAARFESEAHTAMLRELGESVDAARFELPDPLPSHPTLSPTLPQGGGRTEEREQIELPVKLKVHDSLFVPLAKWAMLLTGNYRCLLDHGVRSIKEAVHDDIEASRSVYEWVVELCVSLGADRDDMVAFDKYAGAALSLQSPSSAARALSAGVPNIERVDRLVQALGLQKGMRNASVDDTVTRVDDWLVRNRLKG